MEKEPLTDEALRALFEDVGPGLHADNSRAKIDAMLQDPDRYYAVAKEVRGEQAEQQVQARLDARRAQDRAAGADTFTGRLRNILDL
jgi:hypothetical protein